MSALLTCCRSSAPVGPTPVDTLAAAFSTDPGFAWVLPDPATRTADLEWIFAGGERHCRRVGGVATVDGGAGVGLWATRSTMEIGFLDAALAGMLLLPLQIGFGAMGRLTRAEREGDDLVRAAVDGDFAYLMALAVSPRSQGRGVGGRTVALVESQARAAGHRTLALRTENLDNVSLYRHLGFEVVAQAVAEGSGLLVTAMAKSL